MTTRRCVIPRLRARSMPATNTVGGLTIRGPSKSCLEVRIASSTGRIS